jgi:hypothetical protein
LSAAFALVSGGLDNLRGGGRVLSTSRTKGALAAEYHLHAMGTPVHELAAQAPNVTVPDDFDLGDEDEKLDDCSTRLFFLCYNFRQYPKKKDLIIRIEKLS